MSELTPVRKERIQNKITKSVLKDEGREKLDQIIQVNELSDSDAEEMVRVAKKQRINVIRRQCMKNVYLGCMIMIMGVAVVYSLVIVMGNLTRPVWILSGFVQLLGVWKIIEGVVGVTMAGSRKGSVEKD